MKSKAIVLREAKDTVAFIYALQNSELGYAETAKGQTEIQKIVAERTVHLNALLWVLEMSPEDVGV